MEKTVSLVGVHTPGVLANEKIINRIDKIEKDSKNLVLIDDT